MSVIRVTGGFKVFSVAAPLPGKKCGFGRNYKSSLNFELNGCNKMCIWLFN